MEVEKTSTGPMKTNINPHLQEDESTAWPIEELIEVQVEPNEPNRVVKIDKGLQGETNRGSELNKDKQRE